MQIQNFGDFEIYKLEKNIDWQYPVITEKQAYDSILSLEKKGNFIYYAIPWATIIDKNLYNIFDEKFFSEYKCKENKIGITVCQHISFRKIIPILNKLNISICFSPHKIKGEEYIGKIKIFAFPLYAANIEDNQRNKNIEILSDREYLYSFIGSYANFYLTDIRKQIFKMKHPKNTFILNNGSEWHFNPIVYEKQVREMEIESKKQTDLDLKCFIYNKTLINSRYSLCPSGSGPNSIRFWESLVVGAIPILLADTLDLPVIKNIKWEDAILFVEEKNVKKIPEILENISKEKEENMRNNCYEIYKLFSKDNFARCIVECLE